MILKFQRYKKSQHFFFNLYLFASCWVSIVSKSNRCRDSLPPRCRFINYRRLKFEDETYLKKTEGVACWTHFSDSKTLVWRNLKWKITISDSWSRSKRTSTLSCLISRSSRYSSSRITSTWFFNSIFWVWKAST